MCGRSARIYTRAMALSILNVSLFRLPKSPIFHVNNPNDLRGSISQIPGSQSCLASALTPISYAICPQK